MVLHANKKDHNLRIYTTFVGMEIQDIKLIKEFREKDYVLLDNISKKKKIIIEY